MRYEPDQSSKSMAAAALAAACAALLTPHAARACSSCGCTLNSDWTTQGYATGAGVRLDARFDYFTQSDYRHGTGPVARDAVAAAGGEVQDSTVNRNLMLGIDYGIARGWAVNLQLPLYDRDHGTYGGAWPTRGEFDTATSMGIGDARLTGRYQGLFGDPGTGLLFGVKLPTGATDATFKSGAPLDRGLQLGTGTTDAVLGLFHFGSLAGDWDYFAQATGQAALLGGGSFRPGNGLNASLGVRYAGYEALTPQVQVNARVEGHETGADGDFPNSGAALVYLSPGVTVPVKQHLRVFGFLQVPIFQRVNGYQIEPSVLLSAGLRYAF